MFKPGAPSPDPLQPFAYLEASVEGPWYVYCMVSHADPDDAMELMRVPLRVVDEVPEIAQRARQLARDLSEVLIRLSAEQAGIAIGEIKLVKVAPEPEKGQ